MKLLSSKYLWPAASLAFGVAIFLFWWLRYPYALAYQEQFQLFLFTDDYLWSRLAEPGGVARYVAEFLVQFYNNVLFGALILSLLLVAVQLLASRLSATRSPLERVLSFLPAVLTLHLLGDTNVLLTFVVSLLLVQLAMWLWQHFALKPAFRLIAGLLLLLVVYAVAGPLVLALALYMLLSEMQTSASRLAGAGRGAAFLLFAVALILVSSYLLPYPVDRLFCGLGYYRFVEVMPALMAAVAVVTAILPTVGGWLARQSRAGVIAGVLAVLLAVGGVGLLPRSYDARVYEVIAYDYLVRAQRWDAIIAKARRHQPDLPLTVCATNLALGMTGQLGDHAFEFYQNGTEGLLPAFSRNFATQFVTGEAFFQLGMVNTAQRFAFESMEAIPNYNKSCRVVKRLAETNLINGHYEVARKYLQMLSHTMFYSRWAARTMQLLGNEQAINAHPLYGRLRQQQLTDDFLFSDRETDKMLGQLFIRNPKNALAVQYLLLWPLLERQPDKFVQYYGFVQERQPYTSRMCEEALAFAFARRGQQPPQGAVSPMTARNFSDFIRVYQQQGKDAPQLGQWRGTVWYYFTKE
ncbi:MAG: hypothetical protein IJ710_08925 [Prevotella sp.]|nr:hypothetical protein [Prevotella sp.]